MTHPEKEKHVKTISMLEENPLLQEKHTFSWQGKEFVVYPHVFSPTVFGDTKFYLNNLKIGKGESFLEIGCGAGLMSVLAALNGASKVFASDISPYAVENTQENAHLHGVSDVVQVFQGSVFEPIPESETFDVIFWNLPSIVTEEREGLTWLERTLYDPGYKGLEQYLKHGRSKLAPDGKLLLGFSSTGGNFEALQYLVQRHELTLEQVTKRVFPKFNNFSIEIYRFR